MPPSDFAKANLDDIVEQLTQTEAIRLTSGLSFFQTAPIPRLGVPSIRVSDGPNGVRGAHFFMGAPAKCLPCGTALGSTWDRELIHEAGLKLLAAEAKLRSASVILAPTCNIQRTPLAGRSFESFSEDPILSGLISASYVNGVQAGGIGTTIKHFVCNDQENDRNGYSVVLSERALREIYLMPFMLAQKLAQPWSVMAAYNRVNGTHCSEHPHLLGDVLRKEWGFEGMIMSDWFGTTGIADALNAGLDLEMPGFRTWRTADLVGRSIKARKTTLQTVKERARNVLELVRKSAEGAPELLDGDGSETSLETPAETALMRTLAAQSIVLLKNSHGLLPLNKDKIKKVAILGGNARAPILSGGGSAALKASWFVSPYDGIVQALGEGVEVGYSEGAAAYTMMPLLDFELSTPSGERGWAASWHAHTENDGMVPREEPVANTIINESKMFLNTANPPGLTRRWTIRLTARLKPRTRDCLFRFGLAVAGRAKLSVDGNIVIDNWTLQCRGDTFFGHGTVEEQGTVPLTAGVAHEVVLEYCNVLGPAVGDAEEAVMDAMAAIQIGGAEVDDADALMAEAVRLAREADVAVVVVGLNGAGETEGVDRTTLALAGRTNELVEKVIKANPNTVVVTQGGSAITMPWADDARAIVHSWYLGNVTGLAIADVLFGAVNPSAKLSITFPRREEDVPAHGHTTSQNGTLFYGEDLYVGYKHYQNRGIVPLFPFGHGLSYTTFAYSDLKISAPTVANRDISVTATLTITNTGAVAGSEVVQLYVAHPPARSLNAAHVPRALRAFAKVRDLAPGKSAEVVLQLDKYAASYWQEDSSSWAVEAGAYKVEVGPSSAELPLVGEFVLEKGFKWNGL